MTEGQKILVLIVDDIPDTRENIRKLLQFEPDIEVVGGAATGKQAIEMTRKLRPNVIMMDINMPDMDGITATEQIMRTVPTAQVVMLSVQNDPDYMRRAMMAGARDFLAKPPAGDELIATIRRVAEMGRQREAMFTGALDAARAGIPTGAGRAPPGKVLTVYSPKGGTGCTTLATNLAVALCSDESPVALVDASLQFGDVAVFLNLQGKHSLVDLAETYDDLDADVVNTVLIPHASGVKVLIAPPNPEAAEGVSADAVRAIVEYLQRRFAYVVVDTASALTDVALSTFDVADLILLVLTPEIPSIKDARLFFDVADALDYPPEKTFLVLNRVDKKGGISAEDVEASIKYPVKAQIPLEERLVLHSINRGTPLVMYSKPTLPGRAIREMAAQVVTELKAAEVTEAD